jgi:hypothetical protein
MDSVTLIPEQVRKRLPDMQEDFVRANGSPFQHFFCPMMMKDELVELCIGHVVNQRIPNSSRATIVQRKDVDGFYGRMFEKDFIVLAWALSKSHEDVVFEPGSNKKIRPRVFLDNQEYDYHDAGVPVAEHHTEVTLKCVDDRVINLVMHKHPTDLPEMPRTWTLRVEHDGRVAAIVSLIKAAYLTLFRLLGYRYALSAAGSSIGYQVLGDFYRANEDKEKAAVMTTAGAYFQEHVNMVRPLAGCDGTMPGGTIADGRAMICIGSSGNPFGMIVFVKTDTRVHGVLMPVYDNPDSAVTYKSFLSNNNDKIRANLCKIEDGCCYVQPNAIEMDWGKNDTSLVSD